jgi:2-polyprenyl-3-methyl-5-hydroxy-6-metoxy-1,4-benzoquinol methylase
MTISKDKFWSNKILGWEKNRYNIKDRLIGKKRRNNSVNERLTVAKKFLLKLVPNKKILEIGCGSGLLAEELVKAGAESYLGYDFAETAIKDAQERCRREKKIRFNLGSVDKIKINEEYDIIFSLGLIDWLEEKEIKKLVELSKDKIWLHSFSEKRQTLIQLIHKIYVTCLYGYKNGMYVPRYDTKDDIKRYFQSNNIYFFQNNKLSFGVIASSFKLDND